MALRPSHVLSILTSVWATNSASTQPVSLLVASPLPHLSSGPVNVCRVLLSWQLRLRTVGSVMEKLLPEPDVLMCTGFGPFHAAVPSPYMTCSWVFRTAPLMASTSTLNRLGPSAFVPSTVLSQARRGAPVSAYTTRWVLSIPVTVGTLVRATASASALLSFGVVARLPIDCCCATDAYLVWPLASVTM